MSKDNERKDVTIYWDVRRKHSNEAYQADYKNSRKAAIHLMCKGCIGIDAGYVIGIRDCTSYSCPLWRYRPYADESKQPEGMIPSKELYNKWNKTKEKSIDESHPLDELFGE